MGHRRPGTLVCLKVPDVCFSSQVNLAPGANWPPRPRRGMPPRHRPSPGGCCRAPATPEPSWARERAPFQYRLVQDRGGREHGLPRHGKSARPHGRDSPSRHNRDRRGPCRNIPPMRPLACPVHQQVDIVRGARSNVGSRGVAGEAQALSRLIEHLARKKQPWRGIAAALRGEVRSQQYSI